METGRARYAVRDKPKLNATDELNENVAKIDARTNAEAQMSK